MGGNSGPFGVVLLSLVPCLLSEMVGQPCREGRGALRVTELDVDVSPQHIAAASARASKFFPNLEAEGSDVRHLHLQTLLQLQGFRREVTRCLVSAGVELGILDACRTSFNPFGSAGMMGMNRLDFPESAFTSSAGDVLSSFGLQVHLE